MGHKRSSRKSEIKRNRNGREHINNCGEGYLASHKFTQIHHIVCVSSMSNATIASLVKDKGKMEFIRECLKLTSWNINEEPNLVGLPLKRAFVKKPAAEWDGWPCHQVDHNPAYTRGVSERLNAKVWQKVLENRKKCKDCNKECNINAESVAAKLIKESEYWMEFLTERGTDPKSTAFCWKNRLSMKDTWYIPFSMDPGDPPAREPPPELEDARTSLKNYLKEVIFKFA